MEKKEGEKRRKCHAQSSLTACHSSGVPKPGNVQGNPPGGKKRGKGQPAEREHYAKKKQRGNRVGGGSVG